MTSIPPIYDRDGITIYNADCRDVLPHIDPSSVGLLLTDPPYGMAYTPQRQSRLRWAGVTVEGDSEPFDPRPLLRYPRCVLWGANWYAQHLPPSGGWIVWDKKPEGKRRGFISSDVELAWSNVAGRTFKAVWQWDGAQRDGNEPFLHPTQKPVGLMAWIIEEFTRPGDLILDPYMGSGPVAAAAYRLGRRYIGVEIVPEYCQIAINRLAQPALFAAS